MEKDQIFKFLTSLIVEYDEVKGRIICQQPLGEVFSEVRKEENHRSVMLGKKGASGPVESFAFVVPETNER